MRVGPIGIALFLAAAVFAQDKPAKPLTPEQAADRVLAAFKAKDAKALKVLAEKDDPDPWLVADELCFRGEHDAAEAFANAAPRKDTEKLPAYVASRRGKPHNAAARKALAAASAALRARNPKAALVAIEAVDAKAGDVVSVRLIHGRGYALRYLRRSEESAKAFLAAADAAERLGWLTRAGLALQESGTSAQDRSDWRGALAAWERALKLREELRHRAGVAGALSEIGEFHWRLGAYAKALDYQERALKMQEDLGDRSGVAGTLGRIGLVHKSLGAYAKALEYQERALKVREELGNRAGVARSLGDIGAIHKRLGAYAKALAYYERSLKMQEGLGDRGGVAWILHSIGEIHKDTGDFPKALGYLERVLKMNEELGYRDGVAAALNTIANIHNRLGAYDKALPYYERSLKMNEELGNRVSVAAVLGNIGLLHKSLGAHAKALDYQERALEIWEDLGYRNGVAWALRHIGLLHKMLGDYAKALDYQEQARALAAELGSLGTEVRALGSLAELQLLLGKPAEALRAARSGVAKLPLLVSGLAEEQGATARERWAGLTETGVRAGMALNDATAVSFFIESGRAGGLLESLGGRERLRLAVLPPALVLADTEARARERAAMKRYTRVLESGDDPDEAWKHVKQARTGVLEVVARIQRSQKARADLPYPRAAPLATICARLRPDEAFVLFEFLENKLLAIVAVRDGARIVDLGKPAAVRTAIERFRAAVMRPDERGLVFAPHESLPFLTRRLRKLLVDPLKLEAKRLLVSPDEELAYVPFALLCDSALAYEPSGTTYELLSEDARKPGTKVLALGDPDYQGKHTRLPASGVEAEAVGDVVRRGKDATIAGLREAVAAQEHWRAVHFACHAWVDPAQPALSSLALADGQLRCLDVFGMSIPADLVVLSACETAKGKMHKAEGIVGFTRAFMLAGAPRVIVSLWKVNDDATRALMVKFYELWKPGKMATATALKKAQEFVRGHDKWKHPYYWAAWQLWGLPD